MSKRLTNADLLQSSDCDAINFADHCAHLDRELARYQEGSTLANDPMIVLTYRRLALRLEGDIARYMTRRGLPTYFDEASSL
jgi:hypothetical protein